MHLTRSGGKRSRDDENNEESKACDELEPCEIEHKVCEYHPFIDAFRIWLKELTEMNSENVKDFVGNGGLPVNCIFKVSCSDDRLDMQKLMYGLSANAEFIPSEHDQRIMLTPIDGST